MTPADQRKAAKAAYMRAWKVRNREKWLAYRRQWRKSDYQKNSQRIRAENAERYWAKRMPLQGALVIPKATEP